MNRREIKAKAKKIANEHLGDFWRGYALILILTYVLQFLVSKLSALSIFNKCLYSMNILGEQECILSNGSIVNSIGSLIISLIVAPLTFGFIYYILKIVRKEKFDANDIFKFKKEFIVIALINLVVYVLTQIGSLLFIIPGIIISLNYSLVSFVYADKQKGVKETLNDSKELIKGHRLDYLLFDLSFMGWIFLSLLTFGILLVWVLPYYQISHALYYENLKTVKN
ncbi:MAG: DUF975 family protein [Bacilli bacterium]|nr:DUF975 family protein [Bacilli bacterium]